MRPAAARSSPASSTRVRRVDPIPAAALGPGRPEHCGRAHIDLGCDDREAEARRLVGLGAERLWDGPRLDHPARSRRAAVLHDRQPTRLTGRSGSSAPGSSAPGSRLLSSPAPGSRLPAPGSGLRLPAPGSRLPAPGALRLPLRVLAPCAKGARSPKGSKVGGVQLACLVATLATPSRRCERIKALGLGHVVDAPPKISPKPRSFSRTFVDRETLHGTDGPDEVDRLLQRRPRSVRPARPARPLHPAPRRGNPPGWKKVGWPSPCGRTYPTLPIRGMSWWMIA